VTCFADPAQLLAEWRRGAARPDWLLTDDMLGTQMSGLELARLVLRESATIRVALVTGNTEPLRLAQLRSSGLPVIVKPATPERLIALLGGATADAFREAPSAV
jgi:CheY-like chemotaxis protein